jgi:hypothetical protein
MEKSNPRLQTLQDVGLGYVHWTIATAGAAHRLAGVTASTGRTFYCWMATTGLPTTFASCWMCCSGSWT